MRPFLIAIACVLVVSTQAQGDWQVLPRNSHALYRSFGLFQDFQSTAVYASAGRLWSSLGGSFALVGDPDTPMHPQVVALASVGPAFYDEADLRAGLAFEFALNPMMRVSAGWMHESGHVMDRVVEPDLAAMSLVAHRVFARFVYDLGPYARMGATLQPRVNGGSAMGFFSANEFVEILPLGAADEATTPSPYLALSLEQTETTAFGLTHTFHAQAGCYFGNHMTNASGPSLRPVVGFYTGADPRLKYLAYKDRSATFAYLGLMLDF